MIKKYEIKKHIIVSIFENNYILGIKHISIYKLLLIDIVPILYT